MVKAKKQRSIMMSEELKPCPFCGSKGRLLDEADYRYDKLPRKNYSVGCTNEKCLVFVTDMDLIGSKEECIKLWNSRCVTDRDVYKIPTGQMSEEEARSHVDKMMRHVQNKAYSGRCRHGNVPGHCRECLGIGE
jgi:hypothetical protein